MSVLIRLAGAGMICSVLLSLGGKGGTKELLRFACACLFLVLCLKSIREPEWSGFQWQRYEPDLKETVAQAQQQAQASLLTETEEALAEELERQAAAMGLHCTLDVYCAADNSGTVSVKALTVNYHSGVRERLSLFRETLATQLEMDRADIIVQEGSP